CEAEPPCPPLPLLPPHPASISTRLLNTPNRCSAVRHLMECHIRWSSAGACGHDHGVGHLSSLWARPKPLRSADQRQGKTATSRGVSTRNQGTVVTLTTSGDNHSRMSCTPYVYYAGELLDCYCAEGPSGSPCRAYVSTRSQPDRHI